MIWSPYGSLFEAEITTEPTLDNMTYASVYPKFLSFLKSVMAG